MKLQIGNYKITSDGTCTTLSETKKHGEKSKKQGVEFEDIIGHYPNIEQCLSRLLEEKMADMHEKADALMLFHEIRAAKKEIIEAVRGRANIK